MEIKRINNSRRNDKTYILLKFNYVSSFLSLIFGILCQFLLDVTLIIPYVFYSYFILNLLNVVFFGKPKYLLQMALITSILSLICTLIITLYSGGVNSPFIYVLGNIVMAGYVATSLFGRIYLYTIITLIIGIFIQTVFEPNMFTNHIPEGSTTFFALFSILFAIYLLGAIFGRELLKAHHKLYKSKVEIEQQIMEKETLLKEVHHRVKNNLQTISSLLNLQAKNSSSKKLKKLIKSSQNRVISMAMIHEMLYMRDSLSKIDYSSYVHELGEYLIKSTNHSKEDIQLNIDISNIQLGIDTAIPLGLLINEVITNSLKYGFEKGQKGQLSITIKKEEENDYVLYIGDNGIGFSEEINVGKPNSLGLRLINNLTKQLAGSLEKDTSKKGTHYIIKFKDLQEKYKRIAA